MAERGPPLRPGKDARRGIRSRVASCGIRVLPRSAACYTTSVSHELFLKGDPEVDSTRRHMERVLNASRTDTLRKAAVAGAAAWGVWRLFRAFAPPKWKGGARQSPQR
jgi:hypothetical protein